MTRQLEILTGMYAGQDEKGYLVMNYFYGTPVSYIKNHIKDAKKMYRKVFREFVSGWCHRQAIEKGIMDSGIPTEQGISKVVDAIKNHEIKPIPDYNRMCELEIE